AAERLDLDRLEPQYVAEQIEAILGQRPDGELVDFIAERSEGIPLFVEELLGAMRDGRIAHDYLPPSLRDVLLARADLDAALREAVGQQLLVIDNSGRGYGFRHALAKAAIHDDLLPGERARLH